jgi:Domain of unknown function (DUF4253)
MARLKAALTKAKVTSLSMRLAFQTDKERWYQLAGPGDEAESIWARLREEMPSMGYWPLLVGPGSDLDVLTQCRQDNNQSEANLLKKARKLQGEAWFDEMQQRVVKNLREALLQAKAQERKQPTSEDWECAHFRKLLRPRGRYQGIPRGEPSPYIEDHARLVVVHNFGPKPLATVHLMLVPARQSWKVPVVVRMGHWNECPLAEEHAAVLRYWEESYHAELIGMHYDMLELRVGRPPRTWRQALQLAREQYIYCPDIVEQGTETLDYLAASLLNAHYWFFWWD